MSDELIKRLRGERYWVDGVEFPDPLSTEAADALTAAQEENERLREVLGDIERNATLWSCAAVASVARAALDGLPR